MRIALVSQEYPPETAKGGLGSQTFLKAHGLAALGHEVHVISRSPDDERGERMDGPVRVTRVPGLSARMRVYTEAADWLTYSSEVAVAVAEQHLAKPFDLVEFPEWGAEGYVHLLNRTEWNHVPTVVQLHGPVVMLARTLGWPAEDSEFFRIASAMEGVCVRLADAVYSSSQCSIDWCARHYGLKREGTPVIHMGVDTQLFSPNGTDKAAHPTVVFTGRLVRNKGVLPLVDAVLELAKEFPDIRLRMIGRGETRVIDEMRRRASAAGHDDALELVGFMPRDQLPHEMSSAHVFAAPSIYEGGPGLVYLEAMGCGLPVIACSGSGSSEVVEDGRNGFLVPPDDVPALAGALRRVLADDALRRRMSEQARRFVVEHADSAAMLRKLEAFYGSVVERFGRKPA
jgi:glycosyltransferase involved in cell wall biosynthesis